MSKEREVVLVFRDLLKRINDTADAVEKSPMDMEFIRNSAEEYKTLEVEYNELLSLPANEVTSNFMFKMVYNGFAETMKNLVKLVGLHYNNLILFYDEEQDNDLAETIVAVKRFREQCNKNFSKVEKQLSAMGHID